MPLACTFASIGGITLRSPNGLNASLRYRHIDSRPAIEDNTMRARGYFLLDAVVNYSQPRYQLEFSAQNLPNVA
jgi:hypothetical protein